jgi:hypothetical protein
MCYGVCMHKEIILTRGYVALVDAADYEFLNQWTWMAVEDRCGLVYARRSLAVRGENNRVVWMHRQITGCPEGWSVDHANGNGLDNRKENLRVCTLSLNNVNIIRKRRVAPYRGIRPLVSGSWQVRLRVDGRNKSFESYKDPVEAAKRYDELALQIHGEFARLNFPT